MFGGQGLLGFNAEVWVFDLWTKKWTQLSPSGAAPSQRGASAAIYDGDNDRMIIFGGNDGVVRNDVWAVTNLSGTTTPVGPHASSLELRSFPNPFNPTTTVEYALRAPGRVRLRIFDANGAVVRTLVDAIEPAGAHRIAWNGRNHAGEPVASGVYFVRVESAGETKTQKVTLLK
jgi:hypothetical protein